MSTTSPTLLLVHAGRPEHLTLQMLLAQSGIADLRTLTAGNLHAAFDLMAQVRVDAVLVTPGTSPAESPQVVRRLRTLDPDLPVIAVVDDADPDATERLYDAGARDCLARHELSGAVLAHVVERAVASRRRGPAIERPDRHDPLTGLLSQVALIEVLGRLLDRRLHRPDFRFAVLAVDVADFYAIRQRIGHPASDELLVTLARRLLASARPIDAVGRLPDAQFVLLLPEVHRADAARAVARRLERTLEAPVSLRQTELAITPRWGLSLSSEIFDGPHDMLGAAVLESKTFWAA